MREASRGSSAMLDARSEEHTSELQSHLNLVCRLLLEKKKKTKDAAERQGQIQVNSKVCMVARTRSVLLVVELEREACCRHPRGGQASDEAKEHGYVS